MIDSIDANLAAVEAADAAAANGADAQGHAPADPTGGAQGRGTRAGRREQGARPPACERQVHGA